MRKHPLDDLKMTQITKNAKNEKCNTEGPGIWRKLKITENEKYTLFQTEIWRGKLKKVENLEMSTVGREYGKKTEKIMEK